MTKALNSLQNDFSYAARGHEQHQFDQERLAIYQELLLNNLHEVVNPCFPVLRSILPTEIWWNTLKNFIKVYPVSSPIFHRLPFFLVQYLKQHPIDNYPFAYELAHYEWIELEVELIEYQEVITKIEPADLLSQVWQLSKAARLLAYDYPVDQISIDYQPQEQSKTYIVVYQKQQQVHFLKLNELSFQLLTAMFDESMSINQVVDALTEMHPQLKREALVEACMPLMQQLYDEALLLAS